MDNSFKMPAVLMDTMFDKEKRESTFKHFAVIVRRQDEMATQEQIDARKKFTEKAKAEAVATLVDGEAEEWSE